MPHLDNGRLVPDDPHVSDDLAIHDLCKRVRHLLDTCESHSLFTKKELWRMRARGCVEPVASLVFCADVNLELFGDFGRLLCELGEFERIRDLLATGSDGAFVTRWTCLSLVDVTRRISNHDTIKANARLAANCLSRFRMENDGEQSPHNDDDENALKNARRVDNHFETASQIYIDGLRRAFRPWEVGRTEDQVRDVLARNHVVDISTLERIAPAADHMLNIDSFISQINSWIHYVSLGLIVHLPGVSFDQTGPSQPIRFFNPSVLKGQAFTPQLVFLCRRLRRLCPYTPKLRDIIDGRGNGAYQETLESLRTLWGDADRGHSIVHQRHLSYLMERQL
ncbi:hypothetical protein EDB92DRAFT_2116872 [Lactarius akahatsu]|uniref:Uncharacterized protein n=1 Tax=Lactarius akahatsu TaxID=416441 RepID=A0AAD4Q7S4_9AGAM|nr:hypothetical protein EDB92DRAFT_2116872 [Lactarius akahatsu]